MREHVTTLKAVKTSRPRPSPEVAAQMAQARATESMAEAIREFTARMGPAADTIHGFGERMDGLCLFLKKKGPWLLGITPGILMLVGAVTPNAARALADVLAHWH